MTDFKRGDALLCISGSVYLVLDLDGPDKYYLHVLSDDGVAVYIDDHDMLLLDSRKTPLWIYDWRKENLPQDTEESKVDALRKIARENVEQAKHLIDKEAICEKQRTQIRTLKENAAEMRAEIMNNCHAHEELLEKMQERDEENINLRIGARNDCDNIELLNASVTELKDEVDAHIRRWMQAERDLKSATTTRDASIQTADALLEELGNVRKDLATMTGWRDAAVTESGVSHAKFEIGQKGLRALREELAAEKGFNEDHAEHISKLCEELSALKRDRDYWMKRNDVNVKACIELRKELDAEKAFNAADGEGPCAAVHAECTHWAQKHTEAEKEVEQLKDLLVNANNETHMLQVTLTARTAERDHLKVESRKWRTYCETARNALGNWQSACAKSNDIKRELYNTVQAVKNAVGYTEGE